MPSVEGRNESPDITSLADKNKHIKIVLIGPDCGGKTTVAEYLRTHYALPGKGNRRIPGDLQMVKSVVDFALEVIPNRGFIQDQWQYPVDIVYTEALGSERSPVKTVEQFILPELQRHNVLFLHVTARPGVLKERFDVRGDELWTFPQILQVAQHYHTYLKKYGKFHWRTLDNSDLDKETSCIRATQIIDRFYLGGDKE